MARQWAPQDTGIEPPIATGRELERLRLRELRTFEGMAAALREVGLDVSAGRLRELERRPQLPADVVAAVSRHRGQPEPIEPEGWSLRRLLRFIRSRFMTPDT